MFYIRLGEHQENTTERTPSKPLANPIKKWKMLGVLLISSPGVLPALHKI